MEADRTASDKAREEYREGCIQAAMLEGVYCGGIGLAAGLAGTWALNAWPPFRILNVSAQTAIVRSWYPFRDC